MKVKGYGYTPESKRGYIEYKPNFFNRKPVYKQYLFIGFKYANNSKTCLWLNVESKKIAENAILDSARYLSDLST